MINSTLLKLSRNLLFLLLFSSSALSLSAADIYHFETSEQQIQFDQLTHNLRCLVCQNQSLAESNAPLAQDLRLQIFNMIKAGQSDQTIKQYLIHRYGEFITYQPPFNTSTYVLWGLPIILLLSGIYIVRRLSS